MASNGQSNGIRWPTSESRLGLGRLNWHWRVVRKDEGGGVLSGLFAKGEENAPEASRGICFPRNMILAYYGEPAALCK